jgi:hypothetical protein
MGMTVDRETVRLYLHAHDYVCKRPTWTLKRTPAGSLQNVSRK